MRASLFLVGALAAGCEAPSRSRLPSEVNIVVRTTDGAYASLLLDLDAPRRRPTLRAAQGLLAFNGARLLQVEVVPRTGTEGEVADLRVVDLLQPAQTGVRLAPEGALQATVEVTGLEEDTLVVHGHGEGWDRWARLDLVGGTLTEFDDAPEAGQFVQHGPGRGFSVYQEGQRLMLRLPHDDERDSWPLMKGVERIVSVSWITEDAVSDAVQALLDDRFKTSNVLVAHARTCAVDGDLGEWSKDEALPVDDPAGVQSGMETWTGPRDASFGVAVRITPGSLCSAVRVRDDDVQPGKDRIEFTFATATFSYDVPVNPETFSDEGAEAAFTDRVSFGIGVEACFDRKIWSTGDILVPFRVLYNDTDAGDAGTTVLATAPDLPWPSLAGVRLPRRE